MGLRESVYWCAWFVIYAVLVAALATVAVGQLFGRVPACGRVAGVATGSAVQLDGDNGGICDGAVL